MEAHKTRKEEILEENSDWQCPAVNLYFIPSLLILDSCLWVKRQNSMHLSITHCFTNVNSWKLRQRRQLNSLCLWKIIHDQNSSLLFFESYTNLDPWIWSSSLFIGASLSEEKLYYKQTFLSVCKGPNSSFTYWTYLQNLETNRGNLMMISII